MLKSLTLKRIISGTGANTYCVFVIMCMQFFSLPFFLNYWSVEKYGTWLALSAIPSYLIIADFGIIAAASNKMNIMMGRKDAKKCRVIFQSAHFLTLIICLGMLFSVLPIIYLFNLIYKIETDQFLALSFLSCSVLLSIYGGLADSVYRAIGINTLGTYISGSIRLFEWLGYLTGLIIEGSYSSVALGGLLFRLIGVSLNTYMITKNQIIFRLGIKHAQKNEIKSLIKPALSFASFNLINALNFQGLTLIIATILGPTEVVIFNTYRTLTRSVVQFIGIFNHAVWPEFSRLYGINSKNIIFYDLYISSFKITLIMSLMLTIAVYLLSPWILNLWTHGKVYFQPQLMVVMLVSAGFAGLIFVPRTLLQSTNNHYKLAIWNAVIVSITLSIAILFGRIYGVNGIAYAILISEICGIYISCKLAHLLLSDIKNKNLSN